MWASTQAGPDWDKDWWPFMLSNMTHVATAVITPIMNLSGTICALEEQTKEILGPHSYSGNSRRPWTIQSLHRVPCMRKVRDQPRSTRKDLVNDLKGAGNTVWKVTVSNTLLFCCSCKVPLLKPVHLQASSGPVTPWMMQRRHGRSSCG